MTLGRWEVCLSDFGRKNEQFKDNDQQTKQMSVVLFRTPSNISDLQNSKRNRNSLLCARMANNVMIMIFILPLK